MNVFLREAIAQILLIMLLGLAIAPFVNREEIMPDSYYDPPEETTDFESPDFDSELTDEELADLRLLTQPFDDDTEALELMVD